MTAYVTAARIVAVVALFALPPLLVPDDAAAADRRYGTRQQTDSKRTTQQPTYVSPQPRPVPKDFAKSTCSYYKAMGQMADYKECRQRNR